MTKESVNMYVFNKREVNDCFIDSKFDNITVIEYSSGSCEVQIWGEYGPDHTFTINPDCSTFFTNLEEAMKYITTGELE